MNLHFFDRRPDETIILLAGFVFAIAQIAIMVAFENEGEEKQNARIQWTDVSLITLTYLPQRVVSLHLEYYLTWVDSRSKLSKIRGQFSVEETQTIRSIVLTADVRQSTQLLPSLSSTAQYHTRSMN